MLSTMHCASGAIHQSARKTKHSWIKARRVETVIVVRLVSLEIVKFDGVIAVRMIKA